ncbi:MAG: LexA family transcriptional regulator [Saprospiraceae bacterium]|nr:LexA family transcriptional regulator [Saprospiraceae bacterium]
MFAANLRHLRTTRSWSQQTLADQLGIPRTTLAGYELGKSEPNLNLLRQIAGVFGVSLDQLLADNLAIGVNEIASSDQLRVLAITTDTADRENIELVRSQASAGYVQHFHQPEYISTLPKISLPTLAEGTYRAFEIAGDSMLPMEPGWIVICTYLESLRDVRDGKTYVVVLKEEGIIYKRLYTDPSTTNLIAVSDNPAYSPLTIPAHQIQEIWQYRAHVGFSDRPDRPGDHDERLLDIQRSLDTLIAQLRQYTS